MPAIPYGSCECGCGSPTPMYRGARARFVPGHYPFARKLEDSYTVLPDGCWEWQFSLNGKGYAQVRVNGRLVSAHRESYKRARGPIPEGLQLDHLCRNRACVNPDHLEPVTPAENTRRGKTFKLTTEDMAAIRKVKADAMQNAPAVTTRGRLRTRVPNGQALCRELADRYGVAPGYILRVWAGLERRNDGPT